MGFKAQLSWLRSGAERTATTLDGYGIELRALQEKVELLTAVVARLDAAVGRIDAENASTAESLRRELRTVTDDLGDRIGVMSERLQSLRR